MYNVNTGLPLNQPSPDALCAVPVFILETHNQTNNKCCFPKFVQADPMIVNAGTTLSLVKAMSSRIVLFSIIWQELRRQDNSPSEAEGIDNVHLKCFKLFDIYII